MNLLRRTLRALLIAGVLAVPAVGLWQRQNIIDWFRLRNYHPPTRIIELADRTAMTGYSRKLFYVQHPMLEDRDSFNQHCPSLEQTIILGCYVNLRGIYLFDVSDPRLAGIEEVTSAHEMLHSAYDRLSKSEKANVDRMTVSVMNGITDERLKQVIDSYRQHDPSVVPNELHSILGTEVRELPKELEDYYKRYFGNRLAVVGYSEQYEAVFTAQQNHIKNLGAQISELEGELKTQKAIIDQMEPGLNADAERLSSLRSQGKVDEYNAGVPDYNNKVNQFRALVTDYNNKVRRLNRLVEEYNSLAVEQKKLNDAIDSHQTTN